VATDALAAIAPRAGDVSQTRMKKIIINKDAPLSASDKVLLATAEVFGAIQGRNKGRQMNMGEITLCRKVSEAMSDATIDEKNIVLLAQLALLGVEIDTNRNYEVNTK